MDGKCTHMGGELWKGGLMGNIVKGPRHGAEYDIISSEIVKKPWISLAKVKDLNRYEVTVVGEEVLIDLWPLTYHQG